MFQNTPTSRQLNSEKNQSEMASSLVSQASKASPFSNGSTAGRILRRGFDSNDDSKATEGESSLKNNIDVVEGTGAKKIPLFLFGQKSDLKKNESLENPKDSVFTKLSSEVLVDKRDEKK